MCLNNRVILSVVLALAPATAFAWEHELQRGLDLYSATDGVAAVRIVCDPNNVYGGTPETAVLVSLGADDDATAEATFRFADNVTVTGPMVHGRISQAHVTAELWTDLLTGFRSNEAVEITMGNRTESVNLGQPMPFTCI